MVVVYDTVLFDDGPTAEPNVYNARVIEMITMGMFIAFLLPKSTTSERRKVE